MGVLKLRTDAERATHRQGATAAPPETTYPLTGHSGASVILHSRGSSCFVRKTAASSAASARLRAQARKQHRLWMMGVPVPKVLQEGEDADGRACFDMSYIPGQTLANAVIQSAPIDGDRVAKALERLIRLFALERGAEIPQSHFRDKIEDVVSLGRDRVDGPLSVMMESCARGLAQKDWSGIPQSPCHGDLSLENIVLTAGKSVAFIDCDVPWISSLWLDFGKLFQDIAGHWCLRNLCIAPSSPEQVNAGQKLEQLRGPLLSLASRIDAALPARLPQMAALCLLRALPYSSDPAVAAFLCQRIHRVLEG